MVSRNNFNKSKGPPKIRTGHDLPAMSHERANNFFIFLRNLRPGLKLSDIAGMSDEQLLTPAVQGEIKAKFGKSFGREKSMAVAKSFLRQLRELHSK